MSVLALRNRELFWSLVRREVRGRYKGSVLGLLWTLVTPLVLMGAYTLVFSVLFTVFPIEDYPAFLLTGLAVWIFFAGGLQAGTASVVANANLLKKVAFPRAVVPLSTLSSHLVTFAVMVAALVPVNLIVRPETRATMILLPVLLVALILMTAGAALALSAVNVYFRDVEHVLAAILLPWFFLTPIFYSFDSLPGRVTSREWAVDVLRYGNPVTPYVESIQDVAFFGVWPSAALLAYVAVVTAVLVVVGIVVFRRLEREMAVEL